MRIQTFGIASAWLLLGKLVKEKLREELWKLASTSYTTALWEERHMKLLWPVWNSGCVYE